MCGCVGRMARGGGNKGRAGDLAWGVFEGDGLEFCAMERVSSVNSG